MKAWWVLFTPILFGTAQAQTNAHPDWTRFERYNKETTPGVAVMILSKGQVLEQRGFGKADLRSLETVTPDTAFNLASDSKQFTAMSAMILEQRGSLNVDEAITKYVPGLPAWANKVKVRHLIYHTSGLPDYMGICDSGHGGMLSNADVVAFLKSAPGLDHEPDTRFEYSNTGYNLLSTVIEGAAHEPFAAFVQREIFDKLGMTSSWILDANNVKTMPHRAIGYSPWPMFDEEDASDCNYLYGDGSVYTTLKDYAKWLVALDRAALVPPSAMARIFTSGKLPSGESLDYGYGWSIGTENGDPLVWHNGSWLGFRSTVVNYPKQGLWIVAFANHRGFDVDAIGAELAAPYRPAARAHARRFGH
jgi:CubicO group peptidase (beta-lactamase class C family)